MKAMRTQAGWLAMALALVALVVAPDLGAMRAGGQTAGPNVTVDPNFLDGLEFRSLEDTFSRGGRVTAVTGVATDKNLYYMGSTGGGVWRTTDAGETWSNLSDGFFEAGSIGAIDVANADPNVIYVGTGSACPRGNVSPGIGMYKSTDAGATWQHVGLRNAGQIGRVVVHPSDPDRVYVAALGNMFGPNPERGVYRSTDGGATWELVHHISDRTGAIDISMDPKAPDTLIAAMWTTERKPWTIESGSTEGGLFRTTDGGDTWTKLTDGLPTDVMVGRIGVSISPADPSRVYAQIEAGGDRGGTYRSDDGGLTWRRMNEDRSLQQRAWYYTHIIADPIDVDTVYGLNVGAAKSTDGGETFGSAGIRSHSDYHDMWINPLDNTALVVGNDGGATVSLDGETWTGQDNQATAELYRLEVDQRWPYWVYGAQQDNSTIAVPSDGNGEPYSVGGGESGHIAVDPRDHNIVYAGNYGGTMSRRDFSGRTPNESVRVYSDSQTGQRAADMKYRQQWNAPIEISPHTPDVVYTTSQYVHRSTNGGLDWEVISPDLTRNDQSRQQYSGGEGITRDNTGVEVYSTIFAFEESPTVPGLLWAGSDDGLMHISRDNGRTWTNVTPADWPEGTINAISPSAHDPGRAHVAMYRYRQADFRPYLFQTNDYGQTWRRIADGSNGIPDWHFTRVIREDPERRGLLYAGTEFGFYVSFDDGAHWQSLQLNLPVTPVTDIKIHRDDLILTTQGRSFWIFDDLAPLRGLQPGMQAPAAILFKPSEAWRAGGRPPTFRYWFRETPTSPVDIVVTDPEGQEVWNVTAQPGAESPDAMSAGRGGRGGFGRGGRGGGGGGGRGAGRGGRGAGGGAAPPPPAGARQGHNRAIWGQLNYEPMFQVPQGTVMWGGRGGPGPKMAPGTYQVRVSSGSWNATETFTLGANPGYPEPMTPEQGAEQLRMARDIGRITKQLYDDIATMRDLKSQANALAEKAGAGSPIAAASERLAEQLTAVEGDMTQLQGSAGQDALNFPGRMDNQLVVLYSALVGPDRRLGTPQIERYNDLKPQAEALLQRAAEAIKTGVAAFNQVATANGQPPIEVRPPGGGGV